MEQVKNALMTPTALGACVVRDTRIKWCALLCINSRIAAAMPVLTLFNISNRLKMPSCVLVMFWRCARLSLSARLCVVCRALAVRFDVTKRTCACMCRLFVSAVVAAALCWSSTIGQQQPPRERLIIITCLSYRTETRTERCALFSPP